MPTTNNEKISARITELSDKIDRLYALESVMNDLDNYVYDKSFSYNEDGSACKDEDGKYVMKISDTPKNKIVSEIIEYLTKKYL
ncbi:MAG: hypothetical protein J6T10_00410 [Methanobrevibacter sp.]|nr:hypothetical protein [Methanobrevibacter sp.]